MIDRLTQPTLTGDPPAEIVGLDWNGLHRGAQFGEFWTAEGWDDSGREADHMSVRDAVRYGLGHVPVVLADERRVTRDNARGGRGKVR